MSKRLSHRDKSPVESRLDGERPASPKAPEGEWQFQDVHREGSYYTRHAPSGPRAGSP